MTKKVKCLTVGDTYIQDIYDTVFKNACKNTDIIRMEYPLLDQLYKNNDIGIAKEYSKIIMTQVYFGILA